jgi:hypothetical protein
MSTFADFLDRVSTRAERREACGGADFGSCQCHRNCRGASLALGLVQPQALVTPVQIPYLGCVAVAPWSCNSLACITRCYLIQCGSISAIVTPSRRIVRALLNRTDSTRRATQ